MGLVVLLVTVVGAWLSPEGVGSCETSPWARHENPDAQQSALVAYRHRRLLAERLPQLYWLVTLVKLLLDSRDAGGGWTFPRPVFWHHLAYFTLWFPGILAVEYLKDVSADFHCVPQGRHSGNAISGHTFYFAWTLATLVLMKPQLPTPIKPAFALFSVVFLVQSFFTWSYGYHSLQQMGYGSVLGLFYAAACWLMLSTLLGKVGN